MNQLGYCELDPPTGYGISCQSNLYSETSNILNHTSNIKNSVVKIKDEIVEELNKEFNFEVEELPELETIKNLIQSFNKIKGEFLDINDKLIKESEKTKKDLELLNSNIKYINSISEEYDNETESNSLNDDIKQKIETLSETIKNNNKLKETRDQYTIIRKEFIRYLSLIKVLNNFNTGSTCSLCLTNNVTNYFDPCGHTSCHDCIQKMRISYGRTSCPFCKNKINMDKPLYFI